MSRPALLRQRKQSVSANALNPAKNEQCPFKAISPAIHVVRNPRAKRMSLRVDSHKRQIRLTLPPRMPIKKALSFVKIHENWISEKAAAFPCDFAYMDGESFHLRGEEIIISSIMNPAARRTNITLNDGRLTVDTNKDDPSARIRRFLKDHAKQALGELAQEKAARINQQIAAVNVRDTVSRWGSCTSDGRLSFSWRLIFAPEEAFDYVVAHEVAHLQHMNHSADFWRTCENLSEDYESGKNWIKQNGEALLIY